MIRIKKIASFCLSIASLISVGIPITSAVRHNDPLYLKLQRKIARGKIRKRRNISTKPEDIVWIGKDKTNQLIWLAKGDEDSGLIHSFKHFFEKRHPYHDLSYKKSYDRLKTDFEQHDLLNIQSLFSAQMYEKFVEKEGDKGILIMVPKYSDLYPYYKIVFNSFDGYIITIMRLNKTTATQTRNSLRRQQDMYNPVIIIETDASDNNGNSVIVWTDASQ